jgi:hypothetical protein
LESVCNFLSGNKWNPPQVQYQVSRASGLLD